MNKKWIKKIFAILDVIAYVSCRVKHMVFFLVPLSSSKKSRKIVRGSFCSVHEITGFQILKHPFVQILSTLQIFFSLCRQKKYRFVANQIPLMWARKLEKHGSPVIFCMY